MSRRPDPPWDREAFLARLRLVPMEVAEAVVDVLSVPQEVFDDRVREDADQLREHIADGVFDNPQAITGLEYEFYAVTDGRGDEPVGSLARVPRRLLEYIGFEKELGLHNAELSTQPLPLNADGLAAQEAAVRAQVRAATTYLRDEDLRVVSDGLWTIPPAGETARSYLTDVTESDGIRLADNMSSAPRYHAMAHPVGSYRPSMRIDAPHVSLGADTVMPESLTTSIQPHYQVPRAADVPQYMRYALRVAGPLLALGTNSPFFPPDLYDETDPETILADAWAEHRIPVFESVMNPTGAEAGKVRFPRDVHSIDEAIDRIVEDATLVPLVAEHTGRFDDGFGSFCTKHGTYWRWVRPVFDGATRTAANARIEFRPIPGQPTVRDSIAFLAAFAGLMEALPSIDHPVIDLEWDQARANFYAAARNGLDTDMVWITGDGSTTTDMREIVVDLLGHAGYGLRQSGLDERAVERYLGPLRRRVRYGVTPADWKRQRVSAYLTDEATLAEAITAMQREYVCRQRDTLFTHDFGAWIEDDRYRVDSPRRQRPR